jgi:transcriptional regulator GlxA family with amidase domain
MSNLVYFPPMRKIRIIAYQGAQTLDVTGPAEVFALAARRSGRPLYEVTVATSGGGLVRTTSGLQLATVKLGSGRGLDTLLVAGGSGRGTAGALADLRLISWLRRAAPLVRRLGSVCSGAFVLAQAGLLDGLRAATHWSACDRLAAFRPQVQVDRNAIFVQQGRVWTSAGVTTGIDMALAMVEEDHGAALADTVAAQLVLYARRPGFQSQFSDTLVAQRAKGDPLGPAVARARQQLARLDVPLLARLARLSERTLHRRCQQHLGLTPAKLIEKLRVEQARTLLTTTSRPAKSVASESGFHSPAQMRRAFSRELGVGPRETRLLFGSR